MNIDVYKRQELMRDKRHQEDCFFKAILVENDVTDKKSFKEETLQDVSHCYDNHTLHLSLENKHYSVFVLYETICGEGTTQDYLDPMRKEATQEMCIRDRTLYDLYLDNDVEGYIVFKTLSRKKIMEIINHYYDEKLSITS